jgi:hypothetical protein
MKYTFIKETLRMSVLSQHRIFELCRMFVAGGTAGAIARTATAPLDRIKLLFQVQVTDSEQNELGNAVQNICQVYK